MYFLFFLMNDSISHRVLQPQRNFQLRKRNWGERNDVHSAKRDEYFTNTDTAKLLEREILQNGHRRFHSRRAILPNTISVGAGRSRQKRSPSVKVAIVHEHAEYTDWCEYVECTRIHSTLSSSLLCQQRPSKTMVFYHDARTLFFNDTVADGRQPSAAVYLDAPLDFTCNERCTFLQKFTELLSATLAKASNQHPREGPHYLFDSPVIANVHVVRIVTSK